MSTPDVPDDRYLDGHLAPLSPEQIETAIERCRRRIAAGVRVVSDAEDAARAARRAHDRAYAAAFLAHDGPQTEKRYGAELAPEVIATRDARDVAELAYRHAERLADALASELRALQSINRSVSTVYGATTGFGG